MAAMASRSGAGLQFSLAGFPVSVPLNTLIGVAVIAWLWLPEFSGGPALQQWTAAVVFAVVLLASVLLHELAHALAARRYGFPVIGITLWAFGGYTSYRPVRNTPGREAVISASGPAATLLVAGAAWLAWQQVPQATSGLGELLRAVALANALVAVFNMLPGLPLDGGGVLRAGVWALTGSRARGQRVGAYAGMILAALIVAAPLAMAALSGVGADIGFAVVSALLAGFLFFGARGALEGADAAARLEGRTAMELAVPAVVVPGTATVAALDAVLSQHQARHGARSGIIALVGEPQQGLRGYAVPQALAAVPPQARATTSVSSVTRSVPVWNWLPADTPAEAAVDALRELRYPVVLADAANRPVGVIMLTEGV